MATPTQCADELLETVPHLMRVIRTNVRQQSGPELSIVQFRTLAFLGRNQGAMLSEVANFLGQTLPTASKLIDGPVAARLANRATPSGDRRRISLDLTKAGRRKYDTVVSAAREFLAGKMRHLSTRERTAVLESMQTL